MEANRNTKSKLRGCIEDIAPPGLNSRESGGKGGLLEKNEGKPQALWHFFSPRMLQGQGHLHIRYLR